MTSLVVSILSAGIALFSLGWAIHRDIHLAPRLKMKLFLNTGSIDLQKGIRTKAERLCLHVINMGNIDTLIYYCEIKYPTKIRKQFPQSIIQPNDPQESFPRALNSGFETSIFFPPHALDDLQIQKIGVRTKYGKTVWVNKKMLSQYRKDYQKTLTSTNKE